MDAYLNCKICGLECKKVYSLSRHILRTHNLSTKEYYDKYLKSDNEGICSVCNKTTKFESLSNGYKKYCNHKCSLRSPESKLKRKNTTIKKYGSDHIMKLDTFKNKVKDTHILKYGNYGIQNKHIKNKVQKTNLERYGFECPLQSKEIRDKGKKTLINKYNVDNISKTEKNKSKIKQTNLEKYGVEWGFQFEETKSKIKQTNLEKYGVEYPSQNNEIRQKIINTLLNKYGVDNPLKNDDIKNKISKLNKDKFNKTLNQLLEYLDLKLLDSEYVHAHYYHNWECKLCGNSFRQIWNEVQQGYTCPICYPRIQKTKSKYEYEIIAFLSDFISNIDHGSKDVINPYELDIFIPEKSIAIEFNGLYWHSDKFSNSNYHLMKTNLCEDKGIRLIHIFEDEWILRKEIVKYRLKQILNISNSVKINGRDCKIREIDSKTKNEFLEKFHLQGKDSSRIKLGAFYNDELVSVMTFSHGNISKGSKKQDNIWELNRFCSNYNYHIPGISSKLLTYFKRNYQWDQIFTYADKRWSNGNLYYKLGFEHKYDTKPNYWYIKDFFRIHRFNLRKNENDPKDIPENILRLKEGYLRIWDCGNMKFNITRTKK